jgi:hypothetical protein
VIEMNKKNQTDSAKIAGSFFHASDYQKENELASGLATTHEQASDVYMEGVVDESSEQQ